MRISKGKYTTLFHGSKGGIVGEIKPCSRIRCDFGKGFYTGTDEYQAKSLVYNEEMPIFYELHFDIEQIPNQKILYLNADMDWAYFVLYNRGKLEHIKNTVLYKHLALLEKQYDIIIGPIADDNMTAAIKDFINYRITDRAFLECIKIIDYGEQVVAKTEKACKYFSIVREQELDNRDSVDILKYMIGVKNKNMMSIENTRRKYLKFGKFFEESIDYYNKLLINQASNGAGVGGR